MNKLIFESKNMYTATEPAACGGTRAIIHMDSGYLIETDDPETLILSMNVTKELLQKILRERYEDATWEFQSMNSSKGRMPRRDAGSARKKLNTIAWKA
nr:hypothetical protein [Providencia alcalifaciens]